MNSKKIQIIEFAKELYFVVDSEGKRVNTWESISKQILKKFKLEIHFTTIQKWSKKYDWESLFEKVKMVGIERGKEQLQQKENQLIDEKSQIIADIYQSNKKIQSITQKTLLVRLTGSKLKDGSGNPIDADISNTDLIRLLQHSETTLLELQDKKKQQVNQSNQDPFKQIRDNAGIWYLQKSRN